ncbi:hypothetical protein AJ87_26600 [Rhizobium yanglingense]|nr:hypothetical protein AJ87_26600 [Rhizobium yanglingense]
MDDKLPQLAAIRQKWLCNPHQVIWPLLEQRYARYNPRVNQHVVINLDVTASGSEKLEMIGGKHLAEVVDREVRRIEPIRIYSM